MTHPAVAPQLDDPTTSLRWTTQDGTRLLLGGGRPGEPVVGGLVFRVGVADETLASSGITHLVEHLALAGTYVGTDVHTNGSTGERWTLLHSRGTAEQVAAFLTRVCAQLRRPPLERLAAEVQILRTEATHRPGPSRAPALLARWGAAGHGLVALKEVGLHRTTEQDVLDWTRTRFGAAGGVAFLSTDEVPPGLDLSLPAGLVPEDVTPVDLLGGNPAVTVAPGAGIALDAVVPRGAVAEVLAALLDEALFRELRERRACSYVAQARLSPLDEQRATLALVADALPDQQTGLTEGFLGVLDALVAQPLDQTRVDAVVAQLAAQDRRPAGLGDLLALTAAAAITGRPGPLDEGWRAELRAVTAQDVQQLALLVRSTALVVCPQEAAAAVVRAGFPLLPAADDGPLENAASYQRIGVVGQFVLVGDEGIAERGRGGRRLIRWQDCRAVLAFPDGGRQVIGRRGEAIVVEPGLLQGMSARAVPQLIDARVDQRLLVPLPPRAPQDVPRYGAGRTVVAILQALLIGLAVTLLVAAVVAGFTDGVETGLGLALFSLPVWLGTGWLLTARRLRRLRRQSRERG